MKKIVLFLFIFFLNNLSNVYADNSINKIIFFGDSLTDNGNLYSLLLHIIPKSPPYFKGRFSNGPTWAENLNKYYSPSNKPLDYKIYAVGGATAIYHFPTTKFIAPTTLQLEVHHYLLDGLFSNKDNVLFAIWIGANDYIFNADTNKEDSLTTDVVNKIAWAINTINSYGGKNFLILNLPDLSGTPKTNNMPSQLSLQTMSILHNQKLNAAIQKIQQKIPNININVINIFDIFNDVKSNPEKYNQKYNINITDTKNSCWKGGYTFENKLNAHSINADIQRDLNANNKFNVVDADVVTNFIMNSPELEYTYRMGLAYLNGTLPCANPNEYLFWDSLHPTAIVHDLLAQIVAEKLNNNFSV